MRWAIYSYSREIQWRQGKVRENLFIQFQKRREKNKKKEKRLPSALSHLYLRTRRERTGRIG